MKPRPKEEIFPDGVELSCAEYRDLVEDRNQMFELLCDSLQAWEGEEDSVKEEHAELIERIRVATIKGGAS